jgi:hypothetical protein
MPLYECSACHGVENTALSNYWMRKAKGLALLCSQCDPAIGKWHGQFVKRDVACYEPDGRGFLKPVEVAETPTSDSLPP